jgi:hypothetical protein
MGFFSDVGPKRKIHTDKAGNSLVKNSDGSYSVENKKGKRVNKKDTTKWLNKNKKAQKGFWS